MAVQIVEVARRTDQGMTHPFVCRGDDQEWYFVKGLDAGRKSLIAEWIAGNLALSLDLPIAPFAIVHVPEELVDAGGPLDLSGLGVGPVFGSRLQAGVMELSAVAVQKIPDALQQDVLVFDWWVRNPDRFLTEQGGNPNLFWEPYTGDLVVIDHNQAFSNSFSAKDFFDFHIFREQTCSVFGDMLRHAEYAPRLAAALEAWPRIVDAIPTEWQFADPEQTVPADFDVGAAHRLLARYNDEDFWKTP